MGLRTGVCLLFCAAFICIQAQDRAITVEITVLSDVGGTPSLYLGATATLVCHAQDTVGPLSYHWSSTSNDFFAYNSTAMFNKKTLLSAGDAGNHTCSVTDAHGNTGHATLEMKFEGTMVYVVKSLNYRGLLPLNNSILSHYPTSCSGCLIDFYCFSNSTVSGVGEIVFPDGISHIASTEDIVIERLEYSTLHAQIPNNREHNGVFTCKLPDSNGKALENSIGIYTSMIDLPAIDVSLSGYTDLTRNDSTMDLAEVECYTVNSPPTSVLWKRDGVTMGSDQYETLQIVTDRRSFHYLNILIIKDVVDIIGNITFTCEIENTVGATHHSISVNIPVKSNAKVLYAPYSDSEGEVVKLTCGGTAIPFKATEQLESFITILWLGPTGEQINEENSIRVGSLNHSFGGVVRMLTFNGTKYSHAGVYTCLVTLNMTMVGEQESVVTHHLLVRKNVSLYDSEKSLVEALGDTNMTDLKCMWNGTELPTMEWMFLGNSVISPLGVTNESWDMEMLLCTDRSDCSVWQCGNTFIIQALLIHNVSIEPSSTYPTAGNIFMLICSVISDAPATLKWVGPNGETLHPYSPYLLIEVAETNSTLAFHTLHTSHGGVYTCIASVGGSQSLEQQYVLTVQIPWPTLLVTADSLTINLAGLVSVMCTVELPEEVDIPVAVDIQWNIPSPIHGNSRIYIRRDDSGLPLVFKSIVSINPIVFSDAGLYTCITSIDYRGSDDPQVTGVPWVTQGVTIDVSLNVAIRVLYNPPPDFTLESPPYYRPASSVSLACDSDGTAPFTYHWSSTCSNCFTSDNASSIISIDVLKSSDAGEHTCTVTDATGHTGSASTEISLIGAGVYIIQRDFSTAVPNNTAIRRACSTCVLTLYCFSNSTSTPSRAVITSPNNRDISHQSSSYYNAISVRRVAPSGIRMMLEYNRRYPAPSGIYICKIPDSHGNLIQFSVGIYRDEVGGPSIYWSGAEYSSSSQNNFLMRLECRSRQSIPTNVTWLRNGATVDIDHSSYQTMQIVDTQRSLTESYFRNILIVKTVEGGLGNHTYTCKVENQFGSDLEDILVSREVARIDSPLTTSYGESLVLHCRSIQLPRDYAVSVHIEWRGPNGIHLDGTNGIAVRPIQSSSRSLVFDSLRASMDGVYSCQVTIERYTETKEYTLKVLGKINITGNELPIIAGEGRYITCLWDGSDAVRIAWYLQGLDTIPLASSNTSRTLSLYIDPSTTGLNGTTVICRATDEQGYVYEESTTVYVKDIRVEIHAIYREAPPDFDLTSPHYYRPASSIRLLCIARGASESAVYKWTSTSPRAFVQDEISRAGQSVLNQEVLTAYDAGLHTCTVTDNDGTTVSAHTRIILYGVGLYVDTSVNVRSRSIANNTALIWQYGQRVYVRCYSNSTDDNTTIVVPSGHEYSSYSTYALTVRQLSPSGIRLYTSRYSSPPRGIYTCKGFNSQGKLVEMSFGIYSTATGIPVLSAPSYTDLIEKTNTSGLGMITCNSSGYPPTSLIWKKNNLPLPVNNTNEYQMVQVVISRSSSIYSNILILNDVLTVIGNYTYTCCIGNSSGEVSRDIQVSNSVTLSLSITTAPVLPTYKLRFTLFCRVSVAPKLHDFVVPYMTILWSTPESSDLSAEVQQGVYNDGSSLMQSLTINSVNESHNGMYVCRSFLKLPNDEHNIFKEVDYLLIVKAVSFTAEQFPLITDIPNVVMCTAQESDVFRMEIKAHNESLVVVNDTNSIAITVHPSASYNGTNLACTATTIDGQHYENDLTIIVKELSHDVTIEMSSEVAVAGKNFTLTCTVVCDLPTTISWTYSSGNPLNRKDLYVSPVYVDGDRNILQLHFPSLHTSHGGLYECTSQMNVTSAKNISSQVVLLEVEIAAPIVIVTMDMKGLVNLFSTQVFRCEASSIVEVDTPHTIDIQWSRDPLSSIINQSKVFISNKRGHKNVYYSSLTVYNFTLSDSGNYTCIATAAPTDSMHGVSNKTMSSSERAHASTTLNVNIQVDYNPPSDFSLPSPPYYRPASSVTLTCVAHDTIGTVQYQWISTQNRSFANGARGKSISQEILTAVDAGIHTCRATDEVGNMGSGWTDMKLYGAGIYVNYSKNIISSAVPNNTLLQFTSYSCHNCRLSFYCLSNSTTDNYRPSISYSNGRLFPNTSDYYLRVVEAGPGVTGLYAHNVASRIPRRGIYTCNIADSNGYIIHLNIGAYSSFGPPYFDRVYYRNLIDTEESQDLATIHCNTYSYLPTSVVWLKNGEEIHVDGDKYELLQVVTNRGSSYLENTLIIRDIAGVLNRPAYTCIVGNTAGNISRLINFATSVTLTLSVDVAPDTALRDVDITLNTGFTLLCSGEVTSSIPHHKLHLENYVQVQWSDSTGTIITRDNIDITTHLVNNGHIRSMLVFHQLNKGHHDQLYTCAMTIAIPTTSVIRSDTAHYRIILDVAYFQLKFGLSACSEVQSDYQVAEQLEMDIKAALVSFINQECKCGFLASMIDYGEFNCRNNQFTGYRARIVGGSDTQLSFGLIEILNTWKSTDGTFVYTGGRRWQRVWVDTHCPLEIPSLSATICD